MRKMARKGPGIKKGCSLLLLFVFAVAQLTAVFACTAKEESIAQIPALQLQDADDLPHSREEVIPLSFYTSDGRALGIERRAVTIEDGQERANIAIEELLKGPAEENRSLQALFGNEASEWQVKLRSVQISGNVANVDLYNDSGGINDEAALVKARTALANTLIDYMGVEYVNVFFNGRAVNYQGLVLGAMSRYDGSPESYLTQLRQQAENPSFPIELVGTLYFPDAKGEKLLCEARSIKLESQADFLPDALARIILNELLIKGPRDLSNMQEIVSDLSPVVRPYTVEDKHSLVLAGTKAGKDDKEQTLGEEAAEDLQEEKPIGQEDPQTVKTLSINVLATAKNTDLAEAAIVSSIMSLLSDSELSGIELSFGEGQSLQGGADGLLRENYLKDNACTLSLCFPEAGGDHFELVETSLACADRENPMAILRALQQGPPEARALLPVFPEGSQSGEIIYAYLSDSTAVIDLSKGLIERLEGLDEIAQRNFLYAIIATMVQISGVQDVQFLMEGEVHDKIGPYVIAGPLMPDWGRMP